MQGRPGSVGTERAGMPGRMGVDPWWCSAVEGLVYWAWNEVELNMVPMQCYWSMVNDSTLFIGHLRCLGHRWILMAKLASGWTVTAVGIFNSTIGALYRPVVLENPILTNIIWRFMMFFCTIFNFFSKRLKVSFCDFSTAIFFCFFD